ncbi:hypothetical protein SpCBS45565_g07030 [Spizellomyces sp. 'palustris']|nr:hypothetical protein SpCBS45565_g07030 [Spizellomyces sp. 'palustris']
MLRAQRVGGKVWEEQVGRLTTLKTSYQVPWASPEQYALLGSTRRCPICSQPITKAAFEQHYLWELGRLKGNLSPEPVDDFAKSRMRRGAAVAAAQQIASTNKGKGSGSAGAGQLDENELLLYQVRASRLKRTVQSSKAGSRKRPRGGNDPYAEGDGNTCFMCGDVLPTDSEMVNRHIDQCLAAQMAGPATTSDDTNGGQMWEEYEWAGQTRVRATAMLEGGLAASGFSVHKKTDEDTDEEIDIDDDGTGEFGESQYSEQHIRAFREGGDGDGENGDTVGGTRIGQQLNLCVVCQVVRYTRVEPTDVQQLE